MRLAVAGGTGIVGRLVVAEALRRGHDPVVLARSTGVDVVTGVGLDAGLVGCDAVIDTTNLVTMRRDQATAFFEAASRSLTTAGDRAGVRHHLVLSIVGVDRVPSWPYYAGKLRHEEAALAGPLPVTVLRATQFHEFPGQLLRTAAAGPVSAIPRMRIQPVAAREVATRLVALAEGEPAGRAPDLAGPEVHEVVDLARRLVHARRERRAVIGVPLPGAAGRAMRRGALLPASPGPRGTVRFDDWLTEVTPRG
ncbi:MAG: SDR family oxidoreductase [Kineosporiaceae bacterium]